MNTPETMTHDFSDLTPPRELFQELKRRNSSWLEDITDAYRAGAQQAAERLRRQWPEPITDRPPTEADGDGDGRVQFLWRNNSWHSCHWQHAARNGDPWLHTPRWQPPAPPTLKEQALALLCPELDGQPLSPKDADIIRRALEYTQ